MIKLLIVSAAAAAAGAVAAANKEKLGRKLREEIKTADAFQTPTVKDKYNEPAAKDYGMDYLCV